MNVPEISGKRDLPGSVAAMLQHAKDTMPPAPVPPSGSSAPQAAVGETERAVEPEGARNLRRLGRVPAMGTSGVGCRFAPRPKHFETLSNSALPQTRNARLAGQDLAPEC
ncbi:hypothetical protein J116_025710 [Streptomyces thermolilacinus SPC6]|uniref:Uncharacterized protein n=1 Tax=Streptomyces thermolilacinus SPC6 TaxID=1306406 RepID=A0A1D3DYD8_9ACTN|nr:hypothetical protein J116_025710 [Streptomyces thermolilacinus SPC6]